jgi:hypothetical protein
VLNGVCHQPSPLVHRSTVRALMGVLHKLQQDLF